MYLHSNFTKINQCFTHCFLLCVHAWVHVWVVNIRLYFYYGLWINLCIQYSVLQNYNPVSYLDIP